MKITAILMLATFLQVSAKTYSQITLKEKNASLSKIFKEIKTQTGYDFLYSTELLQNAGTVTVDLKDVSLHEALDVCLEGKSLSYTIEEKTVVVKPDAKKILDELFPPPPVTVHGRIVNESGDPVSGATVTVKGTNNSVSTDSDGRFTLNNVDGNAVLIFTATNIQTSEIGLHGRINVTLTVKTKISPLDEVKVIPYGTTTERLSTSNISTISAKEIGEQSVTNPLLALEGRVPGMEISQANGLPGSAVSVLIRGQNSILNGNDPLYVIDGVPYSSQSLPGLPNILGTSKYNSASSNGNAVYGNPFSYINPADIESISVLKDADATAIYGSKAANGAVIITTKKGKAGQTKVDVNANMGWGQITRKANLLDLQQYLAMRHEALNNDGAIALVNQDFDLLLWDTTRSTNWQKYLIGGTAHLDNIQATVSGGSENTQFLLGVGSDRQTSVFPGDFSDHKTSAHMNLSNTSNNKKFSLVLSASYMVDNNKLLQQDLTSFITLAPDAPPVYKPNGDLNWVPGPSGFSSWPSGNPLAATLSKYNKMTLSLVSNAIISYKLLPNLEIKSNFGYTNMQSNEVATSPLSAFDPAYAQFNFQSSADYANNLSHSWIIEPQMAYKIQAGKGAFDALIGVTVESNITTGTILHGNGYNSDALLENVINASTVTVNGTNNYQYRYNALFGRLKYNWDDKYIANLTVRRDGSSRFGPANQFHNFGAVGLAWVFSQENLFKNQSLLSFGKLRASYGTTGSDQIGDYRFLDLYHPAYLNYQGVKGLVIQNLFNPNLAWEETRKLELSIEMGFFKDRIYLTASYYRHQSSNELAGYTLPTTTGFSGIVANQDVKIQNKGWEFLLNTTNITTEKFRWASSINFTLATNKVVNVGAQFFGDRDILGHSLTSLKVYHYLGVDSKTGLYQFADANGKPTSNPSTPTYWVNLSPTFYGGVRNSITYRKFQLDFLFQIVKQIGPNNYFGNDPGNFFGGNQPVTVLNRWMHPGDISPIQKYNQNFSSFTQLFDAVNSNAAYSDASFIRLKNVAVSYQLPHELKSKLHLQTCRIYLQAQNLLTLTNYQGMDPETLSLKSLPPLRVITVGAQIGL